MNTLRWAWRWQYKAKMAVPCLMTSCSSVADCWLYRGIARSKHDGTRAETRFGLSAKRTSQFKSAGVSVQSTTGSRGVRISGQRLYRPCSGVQSKAAGYPLHSHLSPSLPLPCVTVCHQVPNALLLLPHLLAPNESSSFLRNVHYFFLNYMVS